MPPKRKAAKQASKGKGKAKQPKQDGQKAVTRDLNISLDEGFTAEGKIICWSASKLCSWRHRVLGILAEDQQGAPKFMSTMMGSSSTLL